MQPSCLKQIAGQNKQSLLPKVTRTMNLWVRPSDRTIETEIENLLFTDAATRADLAIALKKLHEEIEVRRAAENELRLHRDTLEERVRERARKNWCGLRKMPRLPTRPRVIFWPTCHTSCVHH